MMKTNRWLWGCWLGLMGIATAQDEAPAPALDPPAADAPADDADVAPGPDALLRGPIHEAYAEPTVFDPRPGPVAPEAPPADVNEEPPAVKPDGQDVQWIGGYWAWEATKSEYLWISGLWRDVPPGRQWVPGYWAKVEEGHQWVSGYWAPVAAPAVDPADPNAPAPPAEQEYLPEPPRSLENGPNVPAPGDGYLWVPGNWSWRATSYLWSPGTWIANSPDWVWNPSEYVCTPSGYLYNPGYWDYPPADRGLLYAPVDFDDGWLASGATYVPSVALYEEGLFENMFCNTTYGGYYFGDYYDPGFAGAGYVPWTGFGGLGIGYDPIYSYCSVNGFALGGYNSFGNACGFGGYGGLGFGGIGLGIGSIGCAGGLGWFGAFSGFNTWDRNCGYNYRNAPCFGGGGRGGFGAGNYWRQRYRQHHDNLARRPELRPRGTYRDELTARRKADSDRAFDTGRNGRGRDFDGRGSVLAQRVSNESGRREGVRLPGRTLGAVSATQRAEATRRGAALRDLAQQRNRIETVGNANLANRPGLTPNRSRPQGAGGGPREVVRRPELPRSPVAANRPANANPGIGRNGDRPGADRPRPTGLVRPDRPAAGLDRLDANRNRLPNAPTIDRNRGGDRPPLNNRGALTNAPALDRNRAGSRAETLSDRDRAPINRNGTTNGLGNRVDAAPRLGGNRLDDATPRPRITLPDRPRESASPRTNPTTPRGNVTGNLPRRSPLVNAPRPSVRNESTPRLPSLDRPRSSSVTPPRTSLPTPRANSNPGPRVFLPQVDRTPSRPSLGGSGGGRPSTLPGLSSGGNRSFGGGNTLPSMPRSNPSIGGNRSSGGNSMPSMPRLNSGNFGGNRSFGGGNSSPSMPRMNSGGGGGSIPSMPRMNLGGGGGGGGGRSIGGGGGSMPNMPRMNSGGGGGGGRNGRGNRGGGNND